MTVTFKEAETLEEIDRCFPVMAQLRPHLSENEFYPTIRRQMDEGYHLAFLEDRGKVIAVAGFRYITSLSSGFHLQLDDLVSDAGNRSQGYGGMLFDWLVSLAKTKGCKKLRLDSGVQRYGAHRFYLRRGMDITCHHFDLML